MFVVKHRIIFFVLSGVLVLTSVGFVLGFGLSFGIEFTGGSITEVRYLETTPTKETLENELDKLALGGFSIRPAGEDSYILRTRDLSEEELTAVMSTLSRSGERELVRERFSQVGPSVGEELRLKALYSIGLVVLAIILFVAYAFRKVSRPVTSWKYGLIAIVALIHDVLLPTGLFAALGFFLGIQVDVLFVMALLAILGYSVNDTIVVFDRVRENLKQNEELNVVEDFELTVGKSLEQTYVRSINTSITTALALLAIFFLGGESTRDFALVLITGIAAGTYSSIFLATPLLVSWAGKKGQV